MCVFIQPLYSILTLVSFITVLIICKILETHFAGKHSHTFLRNSELIDKLQIKILVIHQKFNHIKLATITSERCIAQSESYQKYWIKQQIHFGRNQQRANLIYHQNQSSSVPCLF